MKIFSSVLLALMMVLITTSGCDLASLADLNAITPAPSYSPKTKSELQTIIESEMARQGKNADLNNIDTSAITDMSGLFKDKADFNGDISKWDVSNVTDMSDMFQDASRFNGDLSNWNVSNVNDMSHMFTNSGMINLPDWYFVFEISPSVETLSVRVSQEITPVTFVKNPVEAAGVFSVSPQLPAGLSLSETSGTISGTPTTKSNRMEYSITFTGTDSDEGKLAKSVLIIEIDQIILTPSVSRLSVMTDIVIADITFDTSPADVTGTFSVSPQLPDGLNLDAVSGTISGTPVSSAELKTYTVLFDGSGIYEDISVTRSIEIEVREFSISPSVANIVTKIGTRITDISFEKSIQEVSGSYSISPQLPAGLILDSSTGLISGTPTAVAAATSYTVSFTGSDKYQGIRSSSSIDITVDESLILTASVSSVSIMLNDMITDITFSKNEAEATGSYSVTPALPQGLALNTSNGTISGTARAVSKRIDYSIVFSGNGDYAGRSIAEKVEIAVYSFRPSSKTELIDHIHTNMRDVSLDIDLNYIDTGLISDMSSVFSQTLTQFFKGDISGWDVSNVTNMNRMFYGAKSINSDISGWDVSKVTDMTEMFYDNTVFNHDISGWDVSNVTNMKSMFARAYAFNYDISGWDVSQVTNMTTMFALAQKFNQDISGWDVSNVSTYADFRTLSALSDAHTPAKFR